MEDFPVQVVGGALCQQAAPWVVDGGAASQVHGIPQMGGNAVGSHYKELVFDGAGPEQGVPVLDALYRPGGGYKEDADVLQCQLPYQLREAQVVADDDAALDAVDAEGCQPASRGEVGIFPGRGEKMRLFVGGDVCTGSVKDIAGVVDFALPCYGDGACDDVDSVFGGKPAHVLFPDILAVSVLADWLRVKARIPQLRQQYGIRPLVTVDGLVQHGCHCIQVVLDIALLDGHLQNRYFHDKINSLS